MSPATEELKHLQIVSGHYPQVMIARVIKLKKHGASYKKA